MVGGLTEEFSGEKVVEKIVSWEKNGLFHSQFYLPLDVTGIADRSDSKRKKLTLVAYDDDIERQTKSGQPLIPKELRTDKEGPTEVPLSKVDSLPLFSAKKLFWSPSGTLLGLLLTDLKRKASTLLVYNRSNFTWCLKLRRNLDFLASDGWFLEDNRVGLLGKEGQLHSVQFEWVYQVGSYTAE